MAVLAFIAVPIILFLVLIVMVHMRNRKLKSILEEQMAERQLLDKMSADSTAVYYVELNTGSFEILHLSAGTNVKEMNLKQYMESVTFENRSPIENGNPVGEQIVLEGADAVKEMLSGFVKGIRVFALFEENRRIIMDCITDGIGVDFAFFTVAFTPQTTSVEWDAYIGPAWYET